MKQNKIKTAGKKWTPKEHAKLASIIIGLTNNGVKFKEAYQIAAKELNRSKHAVEYQWRRIKNNYTFNGENVNSKLKIKNLDNKTIREIISENSNNKTTSVTGTRFSNELSELTKNKNTNTNQSIKQPYEGRQKAIPKKGATKLQYLYNSIKALESEDLKILDSGVSGLEYIVINHEEDKGYLVKVDGEKVLDCNCPNRQFREAVCKHMLKVAFDKNLEVF